MPKINDLNLKDWKEEIITIFGDDYKIRETYDINDSGLGIYGYDIYNKYDKFLYHFDGTEDLSTLEDFIKANFYK